ncbi:hypothetical protein D3C77_756920 [compost metagenome]
MLILSRLLGELDKILKRKILMLLAIGEKTLGCPRQTIILKLADHLAEQLMRNKLLIHQ